MNFKPKEKLEAKFLTNELINRTSQHFLLSIESNVFRLATFSLVRNLERVAEKFFGVAEVVVRSVGLLLKPGDRLTGRAIALQRMLFLSSEIFLFTARERVARDNFTALYLPTQNMNSDIKEA